MATYELRLLFFLTFKSETRLLNAFEAFQKWAIHQAGKKQYGLARTSPLKATFFFASDQPVKQENIASITSELEHLGDINSFETKQSTP